MRHYQWSWVQVLDGRKFCVEISRHARARLLERFGLEWTPEEWSRAIVWCVRQWPEVATGRRSRPNAALAPGIIGCFKRLAATIVVVTVTRTYDTRTVLNEYRGQT